MSQNFTTSSAQETNALAKKFASSLSGGDILCLYGDLAAGKTTFAQGLGEHLGVNRVISPTYIILRQYPTTYPGVSRFNHLDLYRLESYKETKSFDLDELWSDKKAVTVIEWPDRLNGHLPPSYYKITFEIVSGSKRRVTIDKVTL